MKKILLATSILAASAGFAAAEVAVTGSARMGLVYNGTDTVFSSRVRVAFGMTGTTDGGLEFGASVRADQSGQGAPGGTANGDSTVYISGAFGKLTMGDVSGAADALVGQTSGVGYGPNDGLHEIDFIGTTKTAAYYEYSTGALTFGLGAGQTTGPGEWNVAVKYATDAFSVAVGYEDSGAGRDQISMLGSATFGSATVKAKVVDDSARADTEFSLSADFATGAATVTAFYTDYSDGAADYLDSRDAHIGLGVAYDLGGGAAMKAGVVRQMNTGAVADETFADLGLTFSF